MKVIAFLCNLCLTITLISVVSFAAENQQQNTDANPIALQIAVAANSKTSTLVFTATNVGKMNLETSPLMTNYNRLMIETPSGQKKEIFSWIHATQPLVLEPTKKRVEKIKVVDLLDAESLVEVGTYRLYWKWLIPTKEGKGFDEYQSNDVFLMKEK